MSSAESLEVPSRLRLHELECAKPTESGLLFQRKEGPFVLPWYRVHRAFVARVGEEQEERIAFQLVLNQHGSECETVRFDLAASEANAAGQHARALLLALGPDACDPVLRTLAEEGVIPRHYLEPDVFDEAVLEATRWTAS